MEQIVKTLLESQAVKFSVNEPFVLPNGWNSPIQYNSCKLLASPTSRLTVVSKLLSTVYMLGKIDAIMGGSKDSLMWSALVADKLNLPNGYIDTKGVYGYEDLKGKKIAIIEDLADESSIKAVQAARRVGAKVVGMAAIFSYGFPQTVDAYILAGVELQTTTSYAALLDGALSMNLLKSGDLPKLKEWQESPENW